MAQIIHAQKVTECRTQEMKASYEVLSAVGQLKGALRGYIIARLNNDPDETTRLHTMVVHLDPRLRSPEAQRRLPQLVSDLQETRREQYNYLRLEEGADEGAYQASLSINVSSVLWAEKVHNGRAASWTLLRPPRISRAVMPQESQPLLSSWPSSLP